MTGFVGENLTINRERIPDKIERTVNATGTSEVPVNLEVHDIRESDTEGDGDELIKLSFPV
jgi:hypothetical protein